MAFSSEQQLVSRFEEVFCEANRNWRWLREFETAAGIADVIGVELSGNSENQYLLAQVPSKWAYTLAALPLATPFDAKAVAGLTNMSMSVATSIIRSFCDLGYCESHDQPRQWIKKANPAPVARKIIAIEAKLRDWRRALYQATQHATYASKSWVLLDATSLATATSHLDEFENRGIGLAGISPDGNIEIAADAADNVPKMPTRFWQANVDIARRLQASLF